VSERIYRFRLKGDENVGKPFEIAYHDESGERVGNWFATVRESHWRNIVADPTFEIAEAESAPVPEWVPVDLGPTT